MIAVPQWRNPSPHEDAFVTSLESLYRRKNRAALVKQGRLMGRAS